MLKSFPPSFPASGNTKFKPLDPMSKDQLALQAKDGTIQCDHPTCKEPLDTSLCTDRCVVVECDGGVVNEQCEQGCVVERAYGCPYEDENSSFARANDEVSITECPFPKRQRQGNARYPPCIFTGLYCAVTTSIACLCYLKVHPALIAFSPVLWLPIHVTSNCIFATTHLPKYRPRFDMYRAQSHRG